MNSSNYRFSLDIHRTQAQVSIPVTLGDTGRVLCINLTDGGAPYSIVDGCLAMISIKRPTGTYIEAFCIIENNTTIKYDFAQNKYTAIVEGIHDCQVTLYDAEGSRITSPRFAMVVSERVVNSDDINITDEDRTAIDAMIEREAARQAAEEARVTAEADRVDAEAARVEAETARASASEEAITATQEAAEKVNKLSSSLAEKVAAGEFDGKDGKDGINGSHGRDGVNGLNGKSVFIRYSANADGTDFTEYWYEGLNYIGFATGFEAPEDKSGYTWCMFVTEINTGFPIAVASAEDMDAALAAAELKDLGSIYEFAGESTDTYEQGALYIIEEEVTE